MRKKFILLMCIILVGGIIGGCSEKKQVAGNSPQELVIGMAADVQGAFQLKKLEGSFQPF